MKNIERIAEELFDKIRSRFEHVVLGDEETNETDDPEKAKFFNFDYVSNTGVNYGNITLSLIDEDGLKIYFSKNLSDKLEETPEDQKEWYDFLKGLRFFAKRNLLKFDTRDISRSNLTVRDLKQVSKSTSAYTTADTPSAVTEGRLTGTSRISTQNFGPSKLIIHHSEAVNEEIPGARSRKIDRMYVETDQGERFLMPFKKLSAGRAMAEHISHGGYMHDAAGKHIVGMVEEMNSLAFFVRNTKHRMFEDSETQAMVEAAVERYQELRHNLKRMSGPRGYESFAENFSPDMPVEEEFDIDALKERFVKKMLDDRIAQALPYVHRAYQNRQAVADDRYFREFDEWADDVAENKVLEDVDVEGLASIMQKPIEAGVDGIDAINVIKDFVPSDDDLFSAITNLSREMGAEADARSVVNQWLTDNGHPSLYVPEPDSAPPTPPAPPAEVKPKEPEKATLEHIRRLAGL
jgi:hypothetical protein